ncbi:MAG: hypothetical protein EXS37_03485 [Opitutus sp.]|nr:hypothetical protein [Opitutus sp.]
MNARRAFHPSVIIAVLGLCASVSARTYTFSSGSSIYSTGGMAMDSAGNAYISTFFSHTIRKITPAVNISTCVVAGSGANKLIAGFIIDGVSVRRVLIRAIGPGLAGFGLTGLLAEPQLELYNGKSLLHATAGARGLQNNADEIRGAFKLADGSKDSAMVVTLLPGNWTVQVSGANSGTDVAIIEVYALP